MSKIEWTGETWNPLAGCSEISPGCANCYAAKIAKRLEAMGPEKYKGTTKTLPNGKIVWTGKINTNASALTIPLKRKKPTTYFVNSMSDLFHEDVPDEFIVQVFDVMRRCVWSGGQNCGKIGGNGHTFQVLTKRAERMQSFMSRLRWTGSELVLDKAIPGNLTAMMEQIWLGVSVEDQQRADERIPHLLKTPAAVRFLSCEPLLGPIKLGRVSPKDKGSYEKATDCLRGQYYQTCGNDDGDIEWLDGERILESISKVDWVIVGGESGRGARPCNVEWIRDIVRQCEAASVPVFAPVTWK